MYTSSAPSGADTNIVPLRNVYPGGSGGTLATLGSGSSPDGMAQFDESSGPVSGESNAITTPAPVTGNPLSWWVGIGVLVALMIFAAKKTGNEGEFSNLRASTYNVAFVTFVAILGITLMKVVAVKVKNVPLLGGFSSVVIAA